jgi:hypothetical protein
MPTAFMSVQVLPVLRGGESLANIQAVRPWMQVLRVSAKTLLGDGAVHQFPSLAEVRRARNDCLIPVMNVPLHSCDIIGLLSIIVIASSCTPYKPEHSGCHRSGASFEVCTGPDKYGQKRPTSK